MSTFNSSMMESVGSTQTKRTTHCCYCTRSFNSTPRSFFTKNSLSCPFCSRPFDPEFLKSKGLDERGFATKRVNPFGSSSFNPNPFTSKPFVPFGSSSFDQNSFVPFGSSSFTSKPFVPFGSSSSSFDSKPFGSSSSSFDSSPFAPKPFVLFGTSPFNLFGSPSLKNDNQKSLSELKEERKKNNLMLRACQKRRKQLKKEIANKECEETNVQSDFNKFLTTPYLPMKNFSDLYKMVMKLKFHDTWGAPGMCITKWQHLNRAKIEVFHNALDNLLTKILSSIMAIINKETLYFKNFMFDCYNFTIKENVEHYKYVIEYQYTNSFF